MGDSGRTTNGGQQSVPGRPGGRGAERSSGLWAGHSGRTPFEVEQRRYPMTRTTVVRPVGELSVTAVSVLRSALRRAVRDDPAVIVVDLGLASVHDADVVAPLVEAARLGRAHGAEVVVATAPEEIAPRLRSCGLTDRRRPRPAPVERPAAPELGRRRHG